MKYLNLLPLILLILSCNNTGNIKNKINVKEENSSKSLEGTNTCIVPLDQQKSRFFKDTVVIWVYPSKFELDSVMHTLTRDESETFEQDYSMYNTDAQSFLSERAEKYMISDSARFYSFLIGNDTTKILLKKLNSKESLWKIILFDGKNLPKVTNPVEIQKEYLQYFRVANQ